MSDTSALQQHFDYWDDYVSHWFMCDASCCSCLPEPWWGWSPMNGRPLYSVVINLNPGKGGSDQTRGSLRQILENRAYSEAMHSGSLPKHLRETHAWHTSYRANSILSRLPGIDINGNDCISHHLSIELSPLHSATSRDVDCYVAANLDDVVHHTLEFAAAAAREIVGPLNGIVIVRCSGNRFREMFRSSGIQVAEPMPVHGLNLCWFSFPQPQFEGVKFVCLWGARNKIPTKELNQIINHIKHQ